MSAHIILLGTRAGQLRSPTDEVLDRAHLAKRVTLALKSNGFEVIGWRIASDKRVVIDVKYTRQCDREIELGNAAYHLVGPGEQRGQFMVDSVRVMWTQRLPAARSGLPLVGGGGAPCAR